MTAPTPNPDGYVHARNEEEYRRLREQARIWAGATARALERAGIEDGMRCLDIGCGPGEAMRLMGERVGAEGYVVGVDIDGRIGRVAVTELEQSVDARFDFVQGNVLDMEEMPHAPFDLVFTRITLLHLSDPAAVLRKMARWTRGGGIVVAQEYDFVSLEIEPHLPAWDEFRRVFEGVFKAHGRGMRVGRNLPALFRAAGLGEPGGFHSEVRFGPLAAAAENLIGVYNGLLPAALALDLTTRERARSFAEAMAEAARGTTHYSLSPLLIAAWTRLPG